MTAFRRWLQRQAVRGQFLLPRFWLTSIVYRLARVRRPAVKDWLIRQFVRLYGIDTNEVGRSVPAEFATFNDFFTRELKDGARPIDPAPDAIVSPVDGIVSEAGSLQGDSILQAKGLDFRLDDLLVTDLASAAAFVDGAFATLYLAPRNYHRVHAPFAGELSSLQYVPGELYAVNTATAAVIRGVFRCNERLILRFGTGFGIAAVIFVGALNVGSITTPWSGEIRPRRKGAVETLAIGGRKRRVERGDLLGWFNLGSTVIVLLPPGACEWNAGFAAGAPIRVGEAIGRVTGPPT